MILIPFFLIWGSFLNVLGYRLVRNQSLTGRSACIHCRHTLAWYDLFPLFSWLYQKGQCRYCHHTISWLYPFVELLTAISLSFLFIQKPWYYALGFSAFFSALIVTIRSDAETMYISRFVTLYAIPFVWLLILAGFLPIPLHYSIAGTLVGYLSLYIFGKLFYYCTGKIGIGEGDFELLAFIGAGTGVFGVFMSVLIGSLLGSMVGITTLLLKKQPLHNQKIPFGPFLAFGAMIYIIGQNPFMRLLFPYSIVLL